MAPVDDEVPKNKLLITWEIVLYATSTTTKNGADMMTNSNSTCGLHVVTTMIDLLRVTPNTDKNETLIRRL